MNRVEGDVVDGVDIGNCPLGRVSVAFEGEVGTVIDQQKGPLAVEGGK